jgi:eukaryotic-like serine/threonine-protein kinase
VAVEVSRTDPQNDPLIGRKLDGRYEVVGRLGEGGVGVVYRGRQTQLGRFVAIKVLQQDAAASPEWRRRFEREARALSALAHPNVVPVTDSGIDNGVPFLVMELLQGKTLADLLKKGPLPLERALDIARQLLRGLAFAHGKGIVHRDLKPANVFLQALPDQTDHVRLLDFGMAKFLDGSTSRSIAETQTRAGAVFGTPAYMSPEQAKGGTIDARTDVYAAGALLFELLAGRRPFVEDTPESVVMAHLTQPVPSLAKVRPALAAAPQFQPLVERSMAKKPSARFKDAGAMLAALDVVIDKLPAEGTGGGRAHARRRTTGGARAVSSGARWGRRALLLLICAAAVAAAAIYLRHERPASLETAASPAKPPVRPSRPAPSPAPVKPKSPAPPAVEAHTAAEDEGSAERPEPAQNERSLRSHSRNPWRAPIPRPLKSIRDRLNHGAHPTPKALQPVHEFASDNPDDPRPLLLLGHAYAQLGWFSDSVERYVKAAHVDSTCRGDPQMLADLLAAVAHPTASRSAARAVRDIYGAEALPALDKAIKGAADDREAAARLVRLRESLR